MQVILGDDSGHKLSSHQAVSTGLLGFLPYELSVSQKTPNLWPHTAEDRQPNPPGLQGQSPGQSPGNNNHESARQHFVVAKKRQVPVSKMARPSHWLKRFCEPMAVSVTDWHGGVPGQREGRKRKKMVPRRVGTGQGLVDLVQQRAEIAAEVGTREILPSSQAQFANTKVHMPAPAISLVQGQVAL